ncbi:MAG: thioredoxin family protein [Bacteroidia bacterium]|nr:thioredoxin family protein [Bacteroidia bacterium]
MKIKTILSVFLIAIATFALISAGEKFETLSIGQKAPKSELKMSDISGKKLALTDIKKENGLLVIFSCNTCPFVLAWEDRYPELGNLTSKNKIGMVLINSNEARRTGDDSVEEMQKHASEKNYNCSYVVDENSALANAFGAKTTPHVFLFDKNMKLVYRGAIDDSEGKENTPKELYLKNALDNLAGGKEIKPQETRSVGCSIKRAS